METIVGKFQSGEHFGFLIPKDRDFYGGDFYVRKKYFGGAEDGDKVEGVEIKSTGKKPEVRIVRVFGNLHHNPLPIGEGINSMTSKGKGEFIEGIYSSGDGNFGFIDVEGQEKGYFVYGEKRGKACDGDKVKAQIVEFKGKKEAIVVKVFESEFGVVIGTFKDNNSFGFVITENDGDIFIPGMKKNGAVEGNKVEVKITKFGKKNKEGIVLKILE